MISAASRNAISRFLAASVGAYGVSAAGSTALSMVLVRIGVDLVEAVYASFLLSFVIFAAIAVIAFQARDQRRIWFWLLGASSLLLGLIWAMSRATA